MSNQERKPVHSLMLEIGERGMFDDDGSIRRAIHKNGGDVVADYGLQEGHESDEEVEDALKEVARGLRKARRILRKRKQEAS